MVPEWADDTAAYGPRRNITRRVFPQALQADGGVALEDGSVVPNVDVVMFCTGALLWYHVPCVQDTCSTVAGVARNSSCCLLVCDWLRRLMNHRALASAWLLLSAVVVLNGSAGYMHVRVYGIVSMFAAARHGDT